MAEETLMPADTAALMALMDDVRCDMLEAQKAFSGSSADELLQGLRGTLNALAEQGEDQKKRDALLVEGKELIEQMVQVGHAMLEETLTLLHALHKPAQVIAPKPGYSCWVTWGSVALAGLLLIAQVYQWVAPAEDYAAFAASLNTAVEQAYPQLPKPAQALLAAAYKKHGYEVPGGRGVR